MSMLNFKYGVHAKLKDQAIANGTIYVTTDEKAMYVDLDDNRIRLSQIITLSTHDWQTLPPPYSTEAFYYLTDSNALLKYNGTAWTQINSTKDLRDALTGLGFLGVLSTVPASGVKGEICTVGGVNYVHNGSKWVGIGKIGAEIVDLKSTVASHTTTLSTHTTDIAGLKEKDTALEGAITLLQQAVGYTGSGTTLPTSPVEGDVFIHNGTIKVYCKNPATATSAAWHILGNESVRIELLKARIEEVAATAGDKTAVTQLRTDLTTLQNTVNDPSSGLAATRDVADEAKQTAEAALPKTEFNTFKTSNTKAIEDAKKAGTSAQTNLEAYMTSNDNVIEAIKNGDNFDSFKDVEDALDNYATKTYAQERAKEVLGTTADAATAATVHGVKKAAAAADTKAGNAQTAANTANTDIATMKNGATITTFKGIEDKINNLTAANIGGMDAYATDTELATEKTNILGKNDDGTNYAGTVKGAYDKAAGAQTTANTAVNNAKTANDAISTMQNGATIKTFKGIEDKINGLDSIYATDTQLADAVKAARGETTETVASVNTKVGTNATNIQKNAQDIADLRDDLAEGLQAADAMVYKGTISAATGLPTSVEIGWTYKVTKDILKTDFSQVTVNWATTSTNPNDEYYVRAGDLFIATGTEGTDGKITAATLKWDHIPAGYNADYVPTMSTSITNGVANVQLTSAHAASNEKGDLGNFQISGATGSAVSISVAAGNNIAIGMTWGTF